MFCQLYVRQGCRVILKRTKGGQFRSIEPGKKLRTNRKERRKQRECIGDCDGIEISIYTVRVRER